MNVSAVSSLASAANSSSGLTGTASTASGAEMFRDVLDKVIDNVNTTDSAFQGDMLKAAEGELDNPHQLLVDSAKAGVAVQLVTSVRNDAMQAYSDIIKMSV